MFHYNMYSVSSSPLFGIVSILFFVAMIFAFWSQWAVFTKIKKYSNVSATKTGVMVAEQMLKDNAIYDVKIKIKNGSIGSEYYDPTKKCVVLSEECANSYSISAISIAAHEVGHAIQHSYNDPFSVLRMKIARPVSFISRTAMFILIFGSIISMFTRMSPIFIVAGIIGFGITFVFQLITLPVEFDASKRALTYLSDTNIAVGQNLEDCRLVLRAAALTYVAATLVTLVQLLRFILIFLNNRD